MILAPRMTTRLKLLQSDSIAYGKGQNHSEVHITGIVDWDWASFVPEVYAYRAPFWMRIWSATDDDSTTWGDEENAGFEPDTDEERTLKQLFLDTASEKYLRYAFAPEAWVARRPIALLRVGIHCKLHNELARKILEFWQDIHPEDNVKVPWYLRENVEYSDSDSDDSSDVETEEDIRYRKAKCLRCKVRDGDLSFKGLLAMKCLTVTRAKWKMRLIR